jgi:predicted small secreted protein
MKKIFLLLGCIVLICFAFSACDTPEESKADISKADTAVSQAVSETESEISEDVSAEVSVTEESVTEESETSDESEVPEENSAPEVSQTVTENTTPEDDGWDFLKKLQVFGGCVSDSADAAAHPFIDGFLEATTRYFKYDEKLELLYPVSITVYRYTDNETAYDLPRITSLLNENEFEQFEAWLGTTELKYQAKKQNVYVYPENSNGEAYTAEYTVVHTELSPDDMEKLVESGKENGYHLSIVFCENDSCLEGKNIYYPDGCVWHDCYEDIGIEVPDYCFNKK